MTRYEYKVLPAPRKGMKAKGVKTADERFALALTTLMNAQAREGWEYVRADTLPMDERKGLTGKATSFQNLLVFRRVVDAAAASLMPPPGPAAAPRIAPPALPHDPAPPRLGPARPDAETTPGGPRLVATEGAHAPDAPEAENPPPDSDQPSRP